MIRAIGRLVVWGGAVSPGRTWYSLTGRMLEKITRMPLAFASSAIDARLPWICSSVIGPVLPAMSFVPARMTTAFGLERDHVGPEPDEHLRRRLAADAAPDVGLPGEERAEPRLRPRVGDGIAHEDDAWLARTRGGQRAIRVAVPREVGPVAEPGVVARRGLHGGGELLAGRQRGRRRRGGRRLGGRGNGREHQGGDNRSNGHIGSLCQAGHDVARYRMSGL